MLSVDLGLIVIFVIVWVLLFVLNRIYYDPVNKLIRKREDRIVQDKGKGEKAQEEVEAIINKIDKEIKSARSSSLATKESFEQEALKEKEKMLSEISQECRSQIQEAKNELDRQVKTLQEKLEKNSDAFADQIEKKLLSK
jgi:F-type H+-transporting ATPase subunit b